MQKIPDVFFVVNIGKKFLESVWEGNKLGIRSAFRSGNNTCFLSVSNRVFSNLPSQYVNGTVYKLVI
jgi:hypothetical protein